ncbi:hypothetical protein CKO28_02970 [Rhodovibrio sodomensis]|uniref:Uncharacterized protein n=1 Tax=Rhodovibrio sodomensis TaxID=1088 RepID=A0ABS1D9F6_9PROT|nr:hypothetical protein [Rhodovibrio sodomensis]MBK1667005.1 hypothetical protein [Rhodovibrio sodomensis]
MKLPPIHTPTDLIAPDNFKPPKRYQDRYLQGIFEAGLRTPPVKERKGVHRRDTSSGWYEAFWNGYDGIDVPAAMGGPGTVRRAIFMAGREHRRLEQSGRLPSLADLAS